MSADRPSLARIGIRFLLTLLGVMVLWLVFIEPGYDRFVATAAVWVLHDVESPPMTASVRMFDHYALVLRTQPYANLAPQRLELRTHHNNAPLLIALILTTPGLTRQRRDRTLLIAMAALAVTHVLHFMLAVHWAYAFANVGPYHVTNLRYLNRGFWQSLDDPAQTAKLVVSFALKFYRSVGRLLIPILIWMILCRDGLAAFTLRRGAATAAPHADAR